MKKTALIFGATSMDGRALIPILLSKGYNVLGTTSKSITKTEEYKKVKLFFCDISEKYNIDRVLDGVLEKYKEINEIYLFAAASSPLNANSIDFNSLINTNALPVSHICEFIIKHKLEKVTKLFFASSAEAFGAHGATITEKHLIYPLQTPYALSKGLGTQLCEFYREKYGLFVSYGILFNHSDHNRAENFFVKKLVKGVAEIKLGRREKLEFGNISFFRDESPTKLVVQAMYNILQLKKAENFVLCRGEVFSGQEYLDIAFNYIGIKNWSGYVVINKEINSKNFNGGLTGDCSKARMLLNWRPESISFRRQLEEVIDFELKMLSK